MNTKIKATIITAAAVSILAVSNTTAYFSDNDDQENQFTVGVNTITINEDYIPPDSIEPGTVILKNPSVECIQEDGAVNCYTRIWCEFSDSKADEIMTLDIDTENWVLEDDGFYYYINILEPGESTSPLFTKITVDEETTQETIDEIDELDLIVYAESCQARSTTGDYFYDYVDAWDYWNTAKEGLE